MKGIVLRFDAPLMSFGGVIVDHHGYIDRFPGTSMLTGLIANALGWQHTDFYRLARLQSRLQYAARWDIEPEPVIDYQTVDLGQDKMLGYADRSKRGEPVGGWTTRGEPEHRAGGESAKFGIHQRYRHYWMNGLMTVVVNIIGDEEPDLYAVLEAFRRPARPLYIGRKTCLPSRPLLDPHAPVMEGENVLEILRAVRVWPREHAPVTRNFLACWPVELGVPEGSEIRRVYDMRDWTNQVVVGARSRVEGWITVQVGADGDG